MRTFFAVLKNNYLRTVPRAVSMIVVTVITLVSVVFAVYITGVQQVKGHIAVISENYTDTLPQSSKYLDIKVLHEKPPESALVEQKYDAYVTFDGSGNYNVETLRSDDYKDMLYLLLKNPDSDIGESKAERGVGANILGFMMMFLLMLSYTNLFAFADDKEQGQLNRIAASPSYFGWYLAAHCVYCLSFLLPEYIMLVIMKLYGYNIGFSLLQYAALMLVLASLGISFGLMLNTLIHKPDNANQLGNLITVLTTVLAGCFYSFGKTNSLLGDITKLLPQKDFMDFAEYLENGNAAAHIWPIVYVIVLALAMFSFSCTVLRRMYVKKV